MFGQNFVASARKGLSRTWWRRADGRRSVICQLSRLNFVSNSEGLVNYRLASERDARDHRIARLATRDLGLPSEHSGYRDDRSREGIFSHSFPGRLLTELVLCPSIHDSCVHRLLWPLCELAPQMLLTIGRTPNWTAAKRVQSRRSSR